MSDLGRYILIFVMAMSGLSACVVNEKPKYPHPPIYPNAQRRDVKKLERGQVRVTTFETSDPPEVVQAFYRDALLKQGWHVNMEVDDRVSYGYVNGSRNPAFTLGVTATVKQDGTTHVELRQAISGPFIWAEP